MNNNNSSSNNVAREAGQVGDKVISVGGREGIISGVYPHGRVVGLPTVYRVSDGDETWLVEEKQIVVLTPTPLSGKPFSPRSAREYLFDDFLTVNDRLDLLAVRYDSGEFTNGQYLAEITRVCSNA